MGRIVFLTGPVRSGKSRRAVALASASERVAFVATYRMDPEDGEMAERVKRHQAERPAGWVTVEAPENVAAALQPLHPDCALMDCLSLWLGDRMDHDDELILQAWDRELAAFRAAPWTTIVVSNEVGWSPVPELPVLRRYRDLLGVLNQRSAEAADEAWLCVAGQALRLK
jgi:adenosylcobinamide kinase/adenosylcobinamide-phosphate guanylyltransferase